MLTTKFFNDLENIRNWADEEVFRANAAPDLFNSVHRGAAVSLQELTNKLYEFYYDKENGVYKYPSDEELEEDENKRSDYEDFIELYQNFIKKADEYFTFVKEHEKEAKEEGIKIPSQLRILYSYAKRDLWAREDQKEKDPILENSQAVKDALEAIDAPTNMKDLVQMEQEISDLINQIKEMEKEEPTLDEAPPEVKEEMPKQEEIPKKEEAPQAEEGPHREEEATAAVSEEEVENLLEERLESGKEKDLKKLTEEELNNLSEEEKKKRDAKIEQLRATIIKEIVKNRSKEEKDLQKDLDKTISTATAKLEKEIKDAEDKEKKEKQDKEKAEKKLREEEEKLANQIKEEKEREKAEKAEKEEEERKERQEAEQKDNATIKEANDKAEQLLNNEMGDLLKEMQKADKTILHVNSDEFKAMRDRLYELSDYIKQVKEENQGKDELEQKSRIELQKKIDALEKSVDLYINAKGMGQQWSTRGKKRIDLAYSIGDYLTRVREASLEKYHALEQREVKRLQYEEANREKLEQLKKEKEELEGYIKKSPIYGKIIHEMDKVEELKELPVETFMQRKFKNDVKRYMDLMREGADIAEVKLARAALKESRFLVIRESAYNDLRDDIKKAIRRLDVFAPNIEKNIKPDAEKYRKDPDFFKEHLKEYKHIFDRLEEVENLPINVKNFIKEYNQFINETNHEKLKPEYLQLRLNYLYQSLSSIADTIQFRNIEIEREDGGHEPIPCKELENLLRNSMRSELKEMTDTFLGLSPSKIREGVDSKQYINEFFEEYKEFMDEFCDKCPEAKEARQWLQEELESEQINNNRIAAFFGTKLRKLITEKNIKTYKVNINGIEGKDISGFLGEMTRKMGIGRSFMIDNYKQETLALKQREDKKKIEADLQIVRKEENPQLQERKHLTELYEEMTKGILEMNDGSSSYIQLIKTNEKLRDYVRTKKSTLAYGARLIVSSLRRDIAAIERNGSVANKDQIRGTLDKLYNLCSGQITFIDKENERIAKENRENRIRLEEEKLEREYYYSKLKAGAKENLPILEKEGLLKGYEEVVKELQDKLDKRVKDPEKMLQILNKTEAMIEKIATHEMSEPVKEALKKFSQAAVYGLQLNYLYRARDNWEKIKHDDIVSFCHYQNMMESDRRVGERKMYAENLLSMNILGWDTNCVEDEGVFRFGKGIEEMDEDRVWHNLKKFQMSEADATYCIDGLMETKGLKVEDLSPELQMMKRLFDCRKIVPDLKSVKHLRNYEIITPEDMVHDAKLIEKAKFATRILNKIEKYEENDRKKFIKNSASYIIGMMDNFEKFLEEKYKDKKLYFFKNKPESNLYKEWKEQQLKHREELRHQGRTLTDLDEVKLLKIKEKFKEGMESADQKVKTLETNRAMEERYAIADTLKLPKYVGITRAEEINAIADKKNTINQAEIIYKTILEIPEERWKEVTYEDLKYRSVQSVLAAFRIYHQTTEGKKSPQNTIDVYNTITSYRINSSNALGAIGVYWLNKREHNSNSKNNTYLEERAKEFAEESDLSSFKIPAYRNRAAYMGGVDVLLQSGELGSETMMYIGKITEQYQRNRNREVGYHFDAVKAITDMQKLRYEGRMENLPLIEALRNKEICTVEDCRDTYKRVTMSQLGNKILEDLNKMPPEERISYLEEKGGAERIETQMKRLEEYVDKNMPDFLKDGNDLNTDPKIMDKTMLLLSEDRFMAFLKEEKMLEDKLQKETVSSEKTENEKEIEDPGMEAGR